MKEKENVNLPSDHLPKEEIMKLRASARTNYFINNVYTFFKLNPTTGFTLSQIQSYLRISMNTLQKVLLQLSSERKLYTATENNKNLFFLNGSKTRTTPAVIFNLGSKEYSISTILNNVMPIFLIKESEINLQGYKETKGAIEIEGKYFNEFIENLANHQESLIEEANKILTKELLIK